MVHDAPPKRTSADGLAFPGRLDVDARERHAARSFADVLVEGALDADDDARDGFLRVLDRERDVGAHALAPEIADGAGEKVPLPAVGERLRERRLQVHAHVDEPRIDDESPLAITKPERTLDGAHDAPLELRPRLGHTEAADVDAADRDAFRDQVRATAVVSLQTCGTRTSQDGEEEEGDHERLPHDGRG